MSDKTGERKKIAQAKAEVVCWFCGDANYSTKTAESAMERYVRLRIIQDRRRHAR